MITLLAHHLSVRLLKRLSYLVAIAILLGACGGGNSTATPQNPTINDGPSQIPSDTPNETPNQAPSFTSSITASSNENMTSTGYIAMATDADGDALSFRLRGGDDQALMRIDATSGALDFMTAPDFEAPGDANADNQYQVEVAVSDGRAEASLMVIVQVLNVDDTAPVAQLTFPPLQSLTTANNVTVRGTATDDAGIASVQVNGMDAQSDDDFATWSVTVPLAAGLNTLNVSVKDAAENLFTPERQAQITYQPALIDHPKQMRLDAANNRVLVLMDSRSEINDALVAVDLASGVQTIISAHEQANNTNALRLRNAFALDTANNRAIVSGGEGLLAVDLDTGVRTNFAMLDAGTASDVVIDVANNRALAVAGTHSNAQLVAVDLDTGASTLISSSTTPNADNPLVFPRKIALDMANNRVLLSNVVGGSTRHILGVDITTGERSIVSSPNFPNAKNVISLSQSDNIIIDSTRNRALVVDESTRAIIALDLDSGARTILVGAETPSSDDLFIQPIDIALDADNNRLLILDSDLNSVVAFNLSTSVLSSIANSNTPNTAYSLSTNRAMDFDSEGDRIIVSSRFARSELFMSIHPDDGARSVLASSLPKPTFASLVFDSASNTVFVDEKNTGSIQTVNLANGQRTVFSGRAVPDVRNSFLASSRPLVFDQTNSRMFVPDSSLNAIFSVDATTGARTIISDNATPNADTPFSQIFGVTLDAPNNRLLAIDRLLKAVFAVNLTTGERSILWDGSSANASVALFDPRSLGYDSVNNRVFIIDDGHIIAINLDSGVSTELGKSEAEGGTLPGSPSDMVVDTANNRLIVAGTKSVYAVDLDTGLSTVISNASIAGIEFDAFLVRHVALDTANNRVITSSADSGDHLLIIDLTTGAVTQIRRNVDPSLPVAMAINSNSDRAIVVDTNDRVLAIDLITGERSVVSELDIPGFSAEDIAVHPDNQQAFVAGRFPGNLYRVDLQTGNYDEFFNSQAPGTINASSNFQSIVLDVEHNRALVSSVSRGSGSAIYAIDLTSGIRSVFSDASVPNDVNSLELPGKMAIDTANNRVLVVDDRRDAIIAVDLTTGARTVVSDSSTPNGDNPIFFVEAMTLDSARNRLLLTYDGLGGVVTVDLTDGQRVYLSK